jgi:hypothetical protein
MEGGRVSEVVETTSSDEVVPSAKRRQQDRAEAAERSSALFPDVVRAHYAWERRLHACPDGDRQLERLEREYRSKLAAFEGEQGKVEQVYWSTKAASAVALTVKLGKPPRVDPVRLRESKNVVRFHRVTDWVTGEAPAIADLLSDCDLLASRVEEVLRGASQLIAMRWLVGIATHSLGFFERTQTHPIDGTAVNADKFVADRRKQLQDAEEYYCRAASQAGRIVYLSGMLIGMAVIAVLGALATWLLAKTSMSTHHRSLAMLCLGAGAVGAWVSTISRMGAPGAGKFNLDFELGRKVVRRLGLFRPFLGAVFGLVLFALLASGLLEINVPRGLEPYYYGFAAFLAGFSERFARTTLGAAERRVAPAEHGNACGTTFADGTSSERPTVDII